jgi:hypothetical protein
MQHEAHADGDEELHEPRSWVTKYVSSTRRRTTST